MVDSNYGICHTSNAAVGMLCFFMKSLEKVLEPSMAAAFKEGPKTGIPTVEDMQISADHKKCKHNSTADAIARYLLFLKTPWIPSTRGCSGPATTKLTFIKGQDQ